MSVKSASVKLTVILVVISDVSVVSFTFESAVLLTEGVSFVPLTVIVTVSVSLPPELSVTVTLKTIVAVSPADKKSTSVLVTL